MAELTDHQIRLLQIVDQVRWGEEEMLDGFKWHMIRRAIGIGDHVIEFELEQAVAFYAEHKDAMPPSPPPGSRRSPWIDTWDVEPWRLVEVTEIDSPDMEQFALPELVKYDPEQDG